MCFQHAFGAQVREPTTNTLEARTEAFGQAGICNWSGGVSVFLQIFAHIDFQYVVAMLEGLDGWTWWHGVCLVCRMSGIAPRSLELNHISD